MNFLYKEAGKFQKNENLWSFLLQPEISAKLVHPCSLNSLLSHDIFLGKTFSIRNSKKPLLFINLSCLKTHSLFSWNLFQPNANPPNPPTLFQKSPNPRRRYFTPFLSKHNYLLFEGGAQFVFVASGGNSNAGDVFCHALSPRFPLRRRLQGFSSPPGHEILLVDHLSDLFWRRTWLVPLCLLETKDSRGRRNAGVAVWLGQYRS